MRSIYAGILIAFAMLAPKVISMKAIIVAADGFEDMELFPVSSILRRAGVPLTIASISSSMLVASASGIKLTADKRLAELSASEYDVLILPSFDGMENSQKLMTMIADFNKEKKLIVAMSHAPLILAKTGILENKIATIYPGMESRIPRPRDAKIVIDGNIITSRSPADSMEVGLKLTEILKGKTVAKSMREKIAL